MSLFAASTPPPLTRAAHTRIALWNLRHGGGNERTPAHALHLLTLDADIIILTELRAARGSQLASAPAAHGYAHSCIAAAPQPHINRVAILARVPLHTVACDSPRLLVARAHIPHAAPLTIIAAHIPDESAPRGRADCWQSLLAHARTHAAENSLIAADFNTSRSGIDAPRPGQTCERHMGTLTSLGYTDSWRGFASGATDAWSWQGPRGERHRLDGIHLSQTLQKQAENAVYDTTCVTGGLSDHAAFVLTLRAMDGP